MGLDSLRTFVETGRYYELDLNRKKLAILRDNIKEHQSKVGVKRMEWTEQGVVGFFEGYRIFNNDMNGLKIFLADLGLLPLLCKVEWSVLSEKEQEQMKPWAVSQLSSIRFREKMGRKNDIDTLISFENRICKLDIVQIVDEWKFRKMKYDLLANQWRSIRLNLQSELTIPCCYRLDFGTISCSTREPLISTIDLYNQLGEETIMKYGKVDSSLLPAYIAKGFFSKNDLKRYRKVIDIRLKYTLMQIHVEQRRREFYLEYLRKLSL